MNKKLFLFLFFACLGVTGEVCFTAITNLIKNDPFCGEPVWSLTGKTYVWMLPIYMIIPLVGGWFFKKLQNLPLLARLAVIASAILLVEFISGFLLEQITGQCPWHYTEGITFFGYIRLDYFPAWMFFGFVVETFYNYLDKNLVK